MNRVAKIVLGSMVLCGFLVSSPGSARADCIPDPRGGCRPIVPPPLGLYAVVPVESRLAKQNITSPSDRDTYLLDHFQQLLGNSAVSGLAVKVQWNSLSTGAPSDTDPTVGYDWGILDDAFTTVEEWNATHALNPKTIQLVILPGFFTPQWVFDQMFAAEYSNCALPLPSGVICGWASFLDSEGAGTGLPTLLPLPWNPVYQSAWATFLSALWQKYGGGTAFVSITVAGPTSASAEMILPNKHNDPNALPLWSALLAAEYSTSHPEYLNTDKAFVKAWKDAIDTYESIFDGVTLVATTGSGLPNFKPLGCDPSTDPRCPMPASFADDCGRPNMDCAAEVQILAYFKKTSGNNRKATQTSGIKRKHAGGQDLGLSGVKWLAQTTASSTSPILGGAQFDTAFSGKDPGKEGSPSGTDPTMTPEQALYNVLQMVFDGTTFGPKYGMSGTLGVPMVVSPTKKLPSFAPSNFIIIPSGHAPLNYLQIYDTDFVYASDPDNATKVTIDTRDENGNSLKVDVTAQSLLDQASRRLLKIAEP